ncbi:MAG: DUF192 domain-containing protein [Nanoarchaeota archaeon]|nr:DUF192 domain-containing protein [Nanoarchaeota archaeon]
MKKVVYNIEGKHYSINAEICDTSWKKFRGLIFQKNPVPLLFIYNKEKNLSIHSFFCKPFTAIWLDKNMNSTKVIDAKPSRFNYSGRGKYLLEIPKTTIK